MEGVELQWTATTVSNVCRTAKNIPPENRRLSLSFRMHADLASLSNEDQSYYIDIAEMKYFDGVRNYRRFVLDQMNDDKTRTIIAGLPEEDREYWLGIVEKYAPHYKRLTAYIEGRLPVPRDEMDPEDYIKIKLRQMKEDIGGKETLKVDEVMTLVLDSMWDAISQCRKGQLKLDRKTPWVKPIGDRV